MAYPPPPSQGYAIVAGFLSPMRRVPSQRSPERLVSALQHWQTPHKRFRGEATETDKAPCGEPVKVLSRRNDVDETDPSFLRALYKTFVYVPGATDWNVFRFVGFKGQYPSLADLTAFISEFRVDAAAANYDLHHRGVNGGGYDRATPTQWRTAKTSAPRPWLMRRWHLLVSPNNEPAPCDLYLKWLNYAAGRAADDQYPVRYCNDELCPRQEYAAPAPFMRAVAVRELAVGTADCSGKVRFRLAFPASRRRIAQIAYMWQIACQKRLPKKKQVL
ncbi:hypothetical protein EDB83DRAFT_2313856 [Lactarius deliciosus]|nr:hypothetical protein EDB83DRAFT_2313856 [Lactarius deliciosus]